MQHVVIFIPKYSDYDGIGHQNHLLYQETGHWVVFFGGASFHTKKDPETSRWKAPELVMRSRARCDLGDPQWDAKMRRSEHLSPDFLLDIEV